MKCDSCRQDLTSLRDKGGRAWDCRTCGVRVMGLGRLRRESHSLAVRVKLRADKAERDGRRCCFCLDWLRAVDDSGMVFGVCRVCQTVTIPAGFAPPPEQAKALVQKALVLEREDAREMRRALGEGHAGTVRRTETLRRSKLRWFVVEPFTRGYPLIMTVIAGVAAAIFFQNRIGFYCCWGCFFS